VVWTPEEERDYGDFLRRLKVHAKRLEALDVNYRREGGMTGSREDESH
jgi:hypothetical protein